MDKYNNFSKDDFIREIDRLNHQIDAITKVNPDESLLLKNMNRKYDTDRLFRRSLQSCQGPCSMRLCLFASRC